MRPLFYPLPRADIEHLQNGGADAYGMAPERHVSDGSGLPCRATLTMIPRGAPYLVAAYRPFKGLNPYTETGPIFLGADAVPEVPPSPELPAFLTSLDYIVRGYDMSERIVYGTGGVIATDWIIARCQVLLEMPEVSFVHIRSARNNCFHCRVELG